MFDAKSLLENLIRGAGQSRQPEPQAAAGGLGDILGQLGKALGQGGQGGAQGGRGGQADPGLGGLGDILKNMLPGPGQGQPQGQAHGQSHQGGGAGAGGLGDILGKLQEQLGKGGQGGGHGGRAAPGGSDGGNLMDILGQILGQATSGVKEGAQRVDQATGASGHARDALGKTTGQSPDDIMNQLKDLIAKNQLGAGAAAGGLGAVVLGTKTGRSLAAKALKVGGLALIGGLAYKALQNYQQGRPILDAPGQLSVDEAPRGSGYETAAVTNDAAIIYIRGMIAAAASDGRIDAKEQEKILGDLKQAGLGQHAEEFLANELNNPATIAQLVQGVASEEEAVQLFTAARISIDLDTQEEHDFLVSLAQALNLDGKLVQHIDAAARSAA